MNQLLTRLERIASRMEMLRLDDYLQYQKNWKKRLLMSFLSGIARGVGFSIGFTLLGAVILCFLRKVALVNLPVIGRFLAELVRIVEKNL